MKSFSYILRHSSFAALLDFSEHLAACCGFGSKELLMIRLLTEEMVSAVYSGIALRPGELRFSEKDGMFTISVTVHTDFLGMPKEERDRIISQIGEHKLTGLFAPVQRYMDKLSRADKEIVFESIAGGPGEWRLEDMPPPPGEDSLETSLLKGFADDIRVTVKAKTLTLSVLKKIPDDFLLFYVAQE